MKRDFLAEYNLVRHPDHVQRKVIDYLVGAADLPQEAASWTAVTDPLTRVQMLAQALVTHTKTYAQSSDHRNRPAGLRQAIQRKTLDAFFVRQREEYLEPLGLWSTDLPEPVEGLVALPAYSFALQFTFMLRKPYLSQDDADWYVIDNPVRKEKLFGLPMVAPTSWKGALRAAAARKLAERASGLSVEEFARRRFRLTRLFGDEKGEESRETKAMARFLDQAKDGAGEAYRGLVKKYFDLESDADMPHHAGRLRFYPTFFTRVGLEVINPHPRDTDAGKQPIYIESVPRDAEGAFTLLYVPFDLIGGEETDVKKQVADDLRILGKGMRAMLTIYGFGAKTSSGFGVVEDDLAEPGQLVLKAAGLPPEELEELQPTRPRRKKKKLRRYWKAENQLKDEFLTSQGKLIPEDQYAAHVESLGQEYTKSDRQLYKKARKWWEREGKELAEQQTGEPEPETKTAEQQWAEREFESLSELVDKMDSLAEDLLAEEGE